MARLHLRARAEVTGAGLLRRELSGVDSGVEAIPIERGLFSGFGADGATDPERELNALDVPVIRVIQPVLDWSGLCRATQVIGDLRVRVLLLLRRRCGRW